MGIYRKHMIQTSAYNICPYIYILTRKFDRVSRIALEAEVPHMVITKMNNETNFESVH